MKKNREKTNGNKNWRITFSPIMRYSTIFCLLTLVVIFLGGVVLSIGQMKSTAHASLNSSHAQISQRIDESVTLLESLAELPEFYDPDVAPIKKVKKLDQMAPNYGYMMICYVDDDILVYSDGDEPASLASRDYMQRLFSTGRKQVTDSFAAGADGVTLKYTVAVPLKDKNDNITGCLFCAIYFDEIVEILKDSSGTNNAETTLLGSQGQIMSSTEDLPYGDSIMDEFKKMTIFGTTENRLEEELLSQKPGSYWSFKGGSLRYTVYQRVENTGWDILCSVNVWTIFGEILPSLLLVAGLTVLLCLGLIFVMRRYINRQMQVVDALVDSVNELEKKIYQDQRPEKRDFNEIIRLTSDGLTDSLTGVVTRAVFLKHAAAQLEKADPVLLSALCFVDMDNLKYINDTHGHSDGDVALKSIGYILREYEKRYDGVVGRYGGDEFILLMTNLDDEAELNSILDELVLRFHSEVGSAGHSIPVQCSVGVAIYRPDMELEQLIADADEALYFVKQNGKGYYKIHENGERR